MTMIAIPRTKRPRDAFKVTAQPLSSFPDAASQIDLRAYRTNEAHGRFLVYFYSIPGFKRSKVEKIPPFYDTDLASALLQWNRDNGGEWRGSGCSGSHFYTPNREDAMMMRLFFS